VFVRAVLPAPDTERVQRLLEQVSRRLEIPGRAASTASIAHVSTINAAAAATDGAKWLILL